MKRGRRGTIAEPERTAVEVWGRRAAERNYRILSREKNSSDGGSSKRSDTNRKGEITFG